MGAQKSGPELLRAWIRRMAFETDRAAAAHIGIDYTYLSQILNRRRTPGLDNAVLLERETGIPIEVWLPTDDGNAEPQAVASDRKPRNFKA